MEKTYIYKAGTRKYLKKKNITPEIICQMKTMLSNHTKQEVAEKFSISRPTLDKYIKLSDEEKAEIKISELDERDLARKYCCSIREIRKLLSKEL